MKKLTCLIVVVVAFVIPSACADRVSDLIEKLDDHNDRVRVQAARELGRLGDARALAPLVRCLRDPSSDMRQAAAPALGDLGDARAVEPLTRCLAHKDAKTSAAAGLALRKLRMRQDTEKTIQQLKDKHPGARLRAAETLGKSGDPRAVPPLIACLADRDRIVRRCVAEALGELRDRRAVKPLIACLHSRFDSRIAVAGALGKICDPIAVNALIPYLKNPHPSVRWAVAEALGDIGEVKAIPALSTALPDWTVDAAITDALLKLGWKPKTEAEQVYYWIARQNGKTLHEKWNQAKRVLRKDLTSGVRRRIVNAVCATVSLGKEDVMDALVTALNRFGDRKLAEVYLNCGHARLRRAAEEWAKKHKYMTKIKELPFGVRTGDVRWGSWRPK